MGASAPVLGIVALVALVLLLGGCTEGDSTAAPDDRGAQGCGPVRAADVRGERPGYLGHRALATWPNDHDACAGLWLRTGNGFVPQGVVVEDGTAWVSGYDGTAAVGSRFCALERYDVRTGEQLARVFPVAGQVGTRPPVTCRHGGGLAEDEHGLWLVETARLWLIDPDSLTVQRAWALEPPLRGSYTLVDDAGRVGIGRWDPHHQAQVDWFDTDTLVDSSVLDLTVDAAAGHTSSPHGVQGAVWAERKPWFAQSVSRCGALVGPFGRVGFVPGAEGMALDGDTLWVVSEAGTRHYQDEGGRPVVPQLLRFDVSDVRSWHRPGCRV